MCAQWVTDASGIQPPNEKVCDSHSMRHEGLLYINLQKFTRAATYLFTLIFPVALCSV